MLSLERGWSSIDHPEIETLVETLIDSILRISHYIYSNPLPLLSGLQEKSEYLSASIAAFAKLDRKRLAFTYDAIKNLPEFHAFYSSILLHNVARKLLNSDSLIIIKDSVGIRVDLPNENTQLTEAHQEFHSFPYSPSGLVVWCPLTPVDAKRGTIAIWENTHKELMRFDGDDKNVKSLHAAGLYQEAQKAGQLLLPSELPEPILVRSQVGKVFFLHAQTLHKSISGSAEGARLTCQSRVFNYSHGFFSWKSLYSTFNHGLKQPIEAQKIYDRWRQDSGGQM